MQILWTVLIFVSWPSVWPVFITVSCIFQKILCSIVVGCQVCFMSTKLSFVWSFYNWKKYVVSSYVVSDFLYFYQFLLYTFWDYLKAFTTEIFTHSEIASIIMKSFTHSPSMYPSSFTQVQLTFCHSCFIYSTHHFCCWGILRQILDITFHSSIIL